jgi:hypothetical protein
MGRNGIYGNIWCDDNKDVWQADMPAVRRSR